MDSQYSPPPNGVSSHEDEHLETKIYVATITCLTAFLLLVTFITAVTRFRLWHTNWFLEKLLEVVNNPITWLITQCVTYLAIAPYKNDLYFIWLVVLLIAYDNVGLSFGAIPGSSWLLNEYVSFFYNIYIGYSISRNTDIQEYFVPLLTLWSLVLAKFSVRLLGYKLVKRAYGLNHSKLISDYMKIEHELPNPTKLTDPANMKGCKYLVMGEGGINPTIRAPEYIVEIDMPESVVTVERVWSYHEGLLHPSSGADKRLKQVCLSFAFFKLLKRRFFEYPSAELAQQEKTRQLVFAGLLSSDDNDSIYSVIKMEIGFVRDFFYTRFPVIFAIGSPLFHVIILIGMLGVSLWVSTIAFQRKEDDHTENDYLRSKHHNIDYTITNALLIIIMVMEIVETLTYVFSDWTKVILSCRHVRNRTLFGHIFFDKVYAFLCKWRFSRSLNNTIGQFSLLKNYNKTYPDCLRFNCFPYSRWGWSSLKIAPRGLKKGKAVVLSADVKQAILGSLRTMNGNPTKGEASLKRNEVYVDLAWTCSLKTEFHTLMVWHIATSLCGIHPGNKKTVKPHHSVASQLSNYCAYLLVFLPDMLPESIFSVKLFFRAILSEMEEFFSGASNSDDMYKLMMEAGADSNGVVHMGVGLGRYLMQISDDARRWKIMADFWSEFILFLAPHGKAREHVRNLESGGEFITHLWALLYHAGIVDTTFGGYNP